MGVSFYLTIHPSIYVYMAWLFPRPFSWFAENVLQLDSSIHQYQSAYQKILSTLKDIGQMVQEKWNILSDMLQDYGESISDVRSAFLSLINGQVLSVFTPYFVNQITWMGAERWKKQIHEKISEHLMPSMKEVSGLGTSLKLAILVNFSIVVSRMERNVDEMQSIVEFFT